MLSDAVLVTAIGCVFLFSVVLLLRGPLTKARKIRISLKEIELEASADDFALLFEKSFSFLLKKHHLLFFYSLFDYPEAPRVSDLIPGFIRDGHWEKSDEGKASLGMLRALRGIGFIEPVSGGRWQPDSRVHITDLGQEFHARLRHRRGR